MGQGRVSRSLRNLRWAIAGLGVGALFLWLAARGVDRAAVLAVLSSSSAPSVLLAMLGTFGFMALKTLRWSLLLMPAVSAKRSFLHGVVYVGTAANLVVVHSGELLRSLIVGRHLNVPPSAVLASIGLERLFDMLTVLTMIGVLLLFDFKVVNSIVTAGLVAAVLVLFALTAMLALLKPTKFRRLLARTAMTVLPVPLHAWVRDQVKRGLSGIDILNHPAALGKVFALSVLQWGCIVGVVWVSVSAVGHAIPLADAIAVWVLMVFGLTLPSSPAQVGTTQLAYTVGLTLSSVHAEVAFAASVIYTFTVNLPVMIIGAACWLRVDRADLRLGRAVPERPGGA